MRWELSEEQEMFTEALDAWLERFATPGNIRKWGESGDATEFEQKFVEEGWFSVGLSEELGGQGGGLLELALTSEALGRFAAPSSAWTATVLAAPLLPPEVASDVLNGRGFAALAVDSTHPFEASTGGVELGAGGALTGSVPAVLGADRARFLLVPASGADGLSLHLVDVDAPGVLVQPRRFLDPSRSAADLRFQDVVGQRLDVDASPALAGAGLRAAVLVAADSLGAMDRMLRLAVDYSKQRHQFGVPIGSFQAVKHAAATILVSVEAGRSIAYYAAASVDLGLQDCAMHAAIAKAQVPSSAVRAADSALLMHGAIGYTWEHDLHLYYKRSKLDEQLLGGSGVWNERVAQALPLVPMAHC
ncbi:acyl-CoA dehydrogenase family protein [Prescottella agglutinans]|uniref:Alkylation response protein AidB-like acyl-CoA dehydrogenase n=1 Tax=Prescottella agglutinans TaxID=1644129 RepID=A0ABT6MKZ7_9NOCA|nr:acyl-CoA dehydrogenase [Prescottella agglutinans]MDH6284993.1 alkylation response protein AidB-like acyl-CoA dehydrogenase [Prescottella agglutinans]